MKITNIKAILTAPANIGLCVVKVETDQPGLYGLGCATENLPAFVVMSTGSGVSGGTANWSSGFLPTSYTGVQLRNQGDAI